MRCHFAYLLLCTVSASTILGLPAADANAQGNLISHVQIIEKWFSPDGDGVEDSLTITYTLSDTAHAVDVFILTADSPQTVVDTLLGGMAQSAGTYSLSWNGTDGTGNPVQEGAYTVFLHALNATFDENISRTVHVDLTPPEVAITGSDPGVFAPDIEGQIRMLTVYFYVWNSPPEDSAQVLILIKDPLGAEIAELNPNPVFAGNGSYTAEWDGAEISTDGIHEVKVIVTDRGGHSASDWTDINVDRDDPVISITRPVDGSKLTAIPETLLGWAWDRNGINSDSLKVCYSDTVCAHIDSSFAMADTLFFTIPLADSITEERQYTLFFKARDMLGRGATISYRVTFDTTAPAAPTLDAPADETVRTPFYHLTGTLPSDAHKINIFRNDAWIDSVFAFSGLPYQAALTTGSNIFKINAADEAGNVSPFSNSIEVVFDTSPGLFIPQPFRPGNAFQVNLAREARSVSIRLYDLSGDLVAVLETPASSTSVSVAWNGLNGDYEKVERGPLAAIATVHYASGSKETMREIFLFKP